MDIVRIGRISVVNYEKGMVQVAYTDRGDISGFLPYLNYEYKMPEIDDMVVAIHLPNGISSGFVLGGRWTNKNKPPESGPGLYRKDLSNTPGKGVVRYTDQEGLKLTAPKITFESTGEGTLTVADYIKLAHKVSDLEAKVSNLESQMKSLEGRG